MAEFAKGVLKEDLSEVSQTIDLAHYLGSKPTEEQKQAFADAAIETIKQRTLDNQDVNNKKFARYSQEYADRKGVSVDSVDLFLEGDMLDSIARIKSQEKSGTIKIKVKGKLNTLKAHNHQTGQTLPKRTWFGLLEKEVESIVSSIKEKTVDDRNKKTTLAELREALGLIGLEQE